MIWQIQVNIEEDIVVFFFMTQEAESGGFMIHISSANEVTIPLLNAVNKFCGQVR